MTTTRNPIRLGTRASALATTQSGHVARAIEDALGCAVSLVEISTEGDVNLAPMANLSGTGVFVSALRTALLAGEVDVIVHSLKDLPTTPFPGVVLAAVPKREDARDVVVSSVPLRELAPGSRVGTGAPRRAAQIAALGYPIEIVGLRGNVDTRIGKVRSGELDAVILAAAGIARLGRTDEVIEFLDPQQVLPAPGQGALAVECREGDALAAQIEDALDDADTRACVSAERRVLALLEAGCSAPVGAHATTADGVLDLAAAVASLDGRRVLRERRSGTDPEALATEVAHVLLEGGAADLVASASTDNTAAQP